MLPDCFCRGKSAVPATFFCAHQEKKVQAAPRQLDQRKYFVHTYPTFNGPFVRNTRATSRHLLAPASMPSSTSTCDEGLEKKS